MKKEIYLLRTGGYTALPRRKGRFVAGLLTLMMLLMSGMVKAQLIFDFASSTAGTVAPIGYTKTGVGTYYRSTTGGTSTDVNITCDTYTPAKATSSSIFYFLTANDINGITVRGQGTGNNRAFASLATATSLAGTYTTDNGASGSGTIASGVCGSIAITTTNTISAGTFVRVTLSGNVNVTSLVLNQATIVTPTTQTSVIAASAVTAIGATLSWTNGNGNNRAVFVKAGTGAITNPADGSAYTASADWNNGAPTGTQLGTSGYYCVYNGSGNTVSLTNLSPGTTYTVQSFEYNGTGTGTKYNTTTATDNPKTFATTAASPVINVNNPDLEFSYVKQNTLSAEQSYTVSAQFLSPASGDITVTAPTGFEVSATSGSGFASSVTLPYTSSTLAATTVYVRFAPTGLTAYSGNLSHTGGAAPANNVAVTGTGSLTSTVAVGDYGSVSATSSNWATLATWKRWDGTGWNTNATVAPTLSDNVWILPGTIVNVEASSKTTNNLIVYGDLKSSSAVNSPFYVRVYGAFLEVSNGGFIGSRTNPTGDNADGISLEVYNANQTITGDNTGGVYFSRVRNNIASTLTIDRDVTLTYHGGTNQGGHVAAYYPNLNSASFVLTINAGKTLTFAPWACLATTSSSNANASLSLTVNVNGTLSLSNSPAPNAGAVGINSYIYGGCTTGNTFTLNIGAGGVVNTPEFYPNGTIVGGGVGTGTDAVINVATGGQLTVTNIADLRKPTQTITGAGAFTLGSKATLRIGSTDGISNNTGIGAIQTAQKNLNTEAYYAYEGTVAQVTGNALPATVARLSVNNTAGVTTTLPVAVTEVVTVAGTLNLNSAPLTLKSTDTANGKTAYIAPTTVGSIVGNVIAERYIPGKRAFRFVSHPFNNALGLSSLTDDIDITGLDGATNGFTTTVTNNPSAFWFNPATGDASTTGTNPGWTAFTSTDGAGANVWAKGQGVRLLIRGAKGEGLSGGTYAPSAAVLDMVGTVNTGAQSLDLATGFNLVGNPYPAPVNIAPRIAAAANLNGSTFWVWDASVATTGAYVAVPIATATYNIPMNGVAVVDAAAASAITFSESDKATTTTQNLFRNASSKSGLLELQVLQGGNYWDKLYVKYDNAASTDKDRKDGVKMINPTLNFYTLSNDNKQLSLDARPAGDKDDIIKVGLTTSVPTAYTIKVADYGIAANVEVLLHDKLLDTYTELSQDVEYNFNVTADAATQGTERFELVQRKREAIVPTAAFAVKLSPNPAKDNVLVTFSNEQKAVTSISITSIDGKLIKTVNAGEVTSGKVSIDVKGLAKGTYYVTLNNGTNKTTQALQVQ